MKVKEIVDALEHFAPLPLQESYDNAGLQIGLTDAEVTGVLLCLDITEEIIQEAVVQDCNLIISHHPLIFRGCKQITGRNLVERCILKAIQAGIAIYSAHTNMDNAHGGVSFKMAEKLNLQHVRVLQPEGVGAEEWNETGSGVLGELPTPMTESEFMAMLKQIFEVECLRHNLLKGREISKVALCGGSGAFLIEKAAEKGADVFVTGEVHYHDFFDHEDILLCEIGHYESEQFTKDLFRDVLRQLSPDLRVVLTKINTNPIKYL